MSEVTPKLNKDGLQQVWAKIVQNFATKTLVEAIKTKLETIDENAQVNVIEKVSVNGVALEVTEKGVNVVVPTGTLADLDEVGINNLNTALKALINGKADAVDVYTKAEVDNKIDSAISGVYVFKGSVNFAELPTEGLKVGHTYNIKDAFTTTSGFVEGTGKEYPAGTNVAYTEAGWDCLAGIYDFSEFMLKSDLTDITSEEIDEICVIPEESVTETA